MVTCLTLLDGRVQADLLANRGTNWINSTIKKEKTVICANMEWRSPLTTKNICLWSLCGSKKSRRTVV